MLSGLVWLWCLSADSSWRSGSRALAKLGGKFSCHNVYIPNTAALLVLLEKRVLTIILKSVYSNSRSQWESSKCLLDVMFMLKLGRRFAGCSGTSGSASRLMGCKGPRAPAGPDPMEYVAYVTNRQSRISLDRSKTIFTVWVMRHWQSLPREVVPAPLLETYEDRALSNLI